MPIYEYRCTECDELFELRRPASEAAAVTTCSIGHEARRLLSRFATTGRATAGTADSGPAGGGCGAGCACAAAAAARN